MNTAACAVQDFSYDPFDPAVMADPLPYYRVLRDEHPVYYLEKWDTYALSRFADIWDVLEINDGTFVASEGTLPAATVLAKHNDGPVPDPPLHPHAVSRQLRRPDLRRSPAVHLGPVPAEVRRHARRPDPRAGQRAARRTAAARHASTSPRTTAASSPRRWCANCVGLPVDLAPDVLATVNAGSLAQPGSGVEVANARPGYLEYLVPIVAAPPRRGRRRRAARSSDSLISYRLPDGSAFTDIEAATQMLGVFIGGTETVPKIVAHGLWELSRRPDQLAAVRADLDANVPVAREEMIRYCAPAQWFARTVRKPFTIHDTTIEPGQRIITLLASANRDEREYPDPDEFIWNRPIERLLAFGRGQHFCLGVHLARLEIAIMVSEWLKRVPDYRDRRRGGVAAAVEFPVGLEQRSRRGPGGGLTCGPIGSSRRTPSSGSDIPEKTPESLGDGQVLLRFLAAGVCGSDLPGFRGIEGPAARRHRDERRRDGRLPDPRDRRRSDRQPASRASESATASSAGPRASTG